MQREVKVHGLEQERGTHAHGQQYLIQLRDKSAQGGTQKTGGGKSWNKK